MTELAADNREHFELPELNLPIFQPRVRDIGERRHIYDPIRRQYVRLTPEEWVRQHFLQYLTTSCGYPAALTAVEKGFRFQKMARRADIVVHDRRGRPFLMVECKAPGIPISQSTFDQVSRYNRVIKARFLIVTNGLRHYCWTIDDTGYQFLDGPPPFAAPMDASTNDIAPSETDLANIDPPESDLADTAPPESDLGDIDSTDTDPTDTDPTDTDPTDIDPTDTDPTDEIRS